MTIFHFLVTNLELFALFIKFTILWCSIIILFLQLMNYKEKFRIFFSQLENIGPQEVSSTSPCDVPRSPLKILFDHPREMTSRGRPNLRSKGHIWKVDSRLLQNVLRTSPTGPSKHVIRTMWGHLLDAPKFCFTLLQEVIRLI